MAINQKKWTTIASKIENFKSLDSITPKNTNEENSHVMREIMGYYNKDQASISFMISDKSTHEMIRDISLSSIFQVAYSLQQPIIQIKK